MNPKLERWLAFCLFLISLPTLAAAQQPSETNIAVLVQQLKDSREDVRITAANALGKLGPEAKKAVPDLLGVLNDPRETVTVAAVQALNNILPQTTSQLIEALKDENGQMRAFAAISLARFDQLPKAAVEPLIQALKDKDPLVRFFVAQALLRIDAEQKQRILIPVFLEALRDKDKNVSSGAARCLASVAERFQDKSKELPTAELTRNVTELQSVLKAVEDAIPDQKEAIARIRRSLDHLEAEKRTRLGPLAGAWISQHKLVAGAVIYVLFFLSLWTCILWLRPIWIHRITETLRPYSEVTLPAWLGGMKVSACTALLIGFFQYHRRVLDAWVRQRVASARTSLAGNKTVDARKIHISIPVLVDGSTIPDLSGKDLHSVFARKRGCLLIWGEGGAGKTSLACQLAWWAMSDDAVKRLAEHMMLPVLIEEEFTDSKIAEGKRLVEAIRGRLRDLVAESEPISEELLLHLLRQRRILVIVDHFSEMGDVTRNEIRPEHPDFPVNALVVTSRIEEVLGHVNRTMLEPLRLKRDRLSSFMNTYFSQCGKKDVFTDMEFLAGCLRLSAIVGERDITVLLAKLFAEQMIAAKDGRGELPDNIPDLMLSYLNELNRTATASSPDDRRVQRDAKIIAWECVKDSFRPASTDRQAVVRELGDAEAEARLSYYENRLQLIQTVNPAKDQVRYALDPLAEYLAGFHIVETYAVNEQLWRDFLAQAISVPGAPNTIRDFLLAVRDCCLHCYLVKKKTINVPSWVADELGSRAGLDPEALKRARRKQRIDFLIANLILPDARDRQYAAKELGELGPEAQSAIPALVELLTDPERHVRSAAAQALGQIGLEAKAVVPALVELLKDPEGDVRSAAAQALGRFGSEAKAAVLALIQLLIGPDAQYDEYYAAVNACGQIGSAAAPALVELLIDPAANEHVRSAVAKALGQIGTQAKATVPALIELLKDPEGDVRSAAAQALGQIGSEAKASVPALVELLTDTKRSATAQALGRIGSEAKAAVPALIELLKDPEGDVRSAAAQALGQIGSEAKAAVDFNRI